MVLTPMPPTHFGTGAIDSIARIVRGIGFAPAKARHARAARGPRCRRGCAVPPAGASRAAFGLVSTSQPNHRWWPLVTQNPAVGTLGPGSG
jgi:hypothetical protein